MNSVHCQSCLDAFQELSQKDGQKLEGVFQRVEDGCLDLIALRFPAGMLAIAADADTDTVEVRYHEAETFDKAGLVRVSAHPPWSSLIGQCFGWGWSTINQQGYQDGVLLSFDGLVPSVMLLVAASSFRVCVVNESPLPCGATNDKE
jgi:Family of unknown function (DUF6334)